MDKNQLVHAAISSIGVDYDVEKDLPTGKKLYIPVVIDDNGNRHRLEALGCRKADDAIATSAQAREEVLAKLKAEQAANKAAKQAAVDAAMLSIKA